MNNALNKPVVTTTELAALTHKSDAQGLRQLTLHGALILATATLFWQLRGSGWALPALCVYGVVLIFLFAPLHESIHYTAFRSRGLNRGVAAVCGWVLILPPVYFRYFHLAHHRHTQNPDLDPELTGLQPHSAWSLLLYLTGYPYWKERTSTLLKHASGHVSEPFLTHSQGQQVVREARLYGASYLALMLVSGLAGSSLALWLWLVPVVVGQPALRVFLLSEHSGCEQVTDWLRNTRTTCSNRLVRWLSWNMSFHVEHHAYAAVPFHALPALHRKIRHGIVHLASGYGKTTLDLWKTAARRSAN